jgi:formylmethanofuran dehydrogenase subunit E
MALHAGELLGVPVPDTARRLFAFVETDGCFLDGLVAGSGCSVGHRSMYVLDYGKIAATFVDLASERAVRIAPHPGARTACTSFAPEAANRWSAYLAGYAAMPADRLLIVRRVRPVLSIAAIRSRKNAKATCTTCSEEVMNEREVVVGGEVLCTPCARGAYWQPEGDTEPTARVVYAPDAELERPAI